MGTYWRVRSTHNIHSSICELRCSACILRSTHNICEIRCSACILRSTHNICELRCSACILCSAHNICELRYSACILRSTNYHVPDCRIGCDLLCGATIHLSDG